MERSRFGRGEVRRRATGRAPACEGLEGRLVLSTTGVTPQVPVPMMPWVGAVNSGGPMIPATGHHDMHGFHGGKGPGPGGFNFNPANLSPQAQADFQKLQTDMQAIRAKSAVTPAEQQAVRQDFQQIAQYAPAPTTPGAPGHGHGGHDLGLAHFDGAAAGKDPSQWTADLTAQLQKDNVPQSLIDKTIADLQAVKAASNVTPQDLQSIAADRQALATDLGHKL
jgi:hypothetical protein